MYTLKKVTKIEQKVVNFKVLDTISKIPLMTPFIFPLDTHNNFQKEIPCSQIGCRGVLKLLAPHHALFCIHVYIIQIRKIGGKRGEGNEKRWAHDFVSGKHTRKQKNKIQK